MPKNRQHYRKIKYPDKVTKPKRLVFVRIFLFRSARSKITYFPTVPFALKKLPHFSATALKLYIQFYKCSTLSAISCVLP